MLPSRPLSIHAVTIALLIEAVLRGASTAEIVEHTGLCPCTVRRYIRAMRKHRVVRIESWLPDSRGRECEPVYTIGSAPDAIRKKRSSTERQRDRRKRIKQIEAMQALCGQS